MTRKTTWILVTVGLLACLDAAAWAQTAGITSQPAEAPQTTPAPPPPRDPLAFSPEVEQFLTKLKNPTPWFSWGFDQRNRDEYLNNVPKLDDHSGNRDTNYGRWRSRIWGTIRPVENFEINARLVWEWRNYCEPEGKQSVNAEESDVILDRFNVTWKKILDLPVSMVVGRQDIILGNGWLVQEGTPLDGSRTFFFDAARLAVDLEPCRTKVDLIYIDQQARENKRVEPFNYDAIAPQFLMEQNERGAILWITNNSLKHHQIEGYFIYKNDTPELEDAFDADTYTYGGRLSGDLTSHWRYYAEIAQQLGHRDQRDVCALGANGRLTYLFKDTLNNQLRVTHEYESGDDPSTSADESFDPLWGRWAQFSEIIPREYARETRTYFVNNLHRVAFGHTFNPIPKLEMCSDYHLLFAPHNPVADETGFSRSGCFRGQLLTWLLRYTINPHITGHLLAEFFFPGDYYNDESNDPATFLRAELTFAL